jgi:site-specific DNA-methyltransferase (adenine-specific)|tara:strand:- start:448 stop:1059 length:612 start_codon:yes stop_codon:yes gene_type:complete
MIDLILDDCMNVMKKYDDNHFDLAIVDPPYGINRLNSGGMPKSSGFKKWERKDWDKEIPKKEYFDELFRVSENQIIWGGNYFVEYLYNSQGWVFWFKQTGMTFADGELAWTSFDRATRCYDKSGMGGAGRIHPTQKPIKLYEWLLNKYAEKGQKILDTHLGSGSIAVACYYFGVDLVGVEIDEEYYNKAKERVDNLTKQGTLF